ncbi:uncharacterized protein Z518_03691 [Rhinocladiella mackenziei CBS 650.93]|uniref:protein-tyrosine-phosphatase n=1 Tax=Rhinocladiella mackenziei CBS 650.93 TaxID=1442369 RepID=A0A0D2IJ01_9EURO|nr:uncharacterized protein Z518_03691 [Rhinocladiella mackenziei CBS 650.93]KIX05719.1 hypothetical protein Z518_03691 [Rhinocladiella mackenziei CBS 650.93]
MLATASSPRSNNPRMGNIISKSFPIVPRMSKNDPAATASTTTAPLIPDKIMPNVYLSDIHTARAVLSPNYPAPNRPKIRYVLSVIDNADRQPKVPAGHEPEFVLKLILLRDNANNDLLQALQEACTFIKSSLANDDGGVLVHCQKGVSRSGSVMIGFIMGEMDLDYDTALRYVRRGRSKVKPNSGFQKQLELWRQLKFSIYKPDGTEKDEYQIWKGINEEQIQALGSRWTGQK